MARTRFVAEVLTPEGSVFDGEVEMVSTRTSVGSIGVLAHHAPLLATLDPTELRLYTGEAQPLRFAQGEGYLQVGDNRALLLVEDALPAAGLDVAALQEQLRAADERLAGAQPGSEERRLAERDQRRARAFLRIAQGG